MGVCCTLSRAKTSKFVKGLKILVPQRCIPPIVENPAVPEPRITLSMPFVVESTLRTSRSWVEVRNGYHKGESPLASRF